MARTALTDARIRALRPRNIAYDIRDGKLGGFGVPGPALRPQTHLRPLPASRRPSLEDPRRRSRYERGRSAVECRANSRRHPAGRGPAPRSRRDPLRGRRRDRFRTLPKALEAGNARCQSVLPEKPNPAPLPGTASRRHRPAGCPRLVLFAARDAGRRRPLHASALRDHEGGGSHGPSAAGLQPLPGHPALSPQGGARAFCRTRRYATWRQDCRHMRKLPLSRSPWSASSCSRDAARARS